ncbi:hypothetical protein BGZ46_008698 [Entomortierella lignicola]|nr:hypothetical protein BGZ46_008698 [Entomortierella lignicola]
MVAQVRGVGPGNATRLKSFVDLSTERRITGVVVGGLVYSGQINCSGVDYDTDNRSNYHGSDYNSDVSNSESEWDSENEIEYDSHPAPSDEDDITTPEISISAQVTPEDITVSESSNVNTLNK